MRIWIRAFFAVSALIVAVAVAPSTAVACGNPGERACCLGEGAACVSGAIYVPQSNSGLCGGFKPLGIQSAGVCV
jgi:hypothetical protein